MKQEIKEGKIRIEDAYKFNIIELVKHHKKNCEGENCVLSLYLLRDMAEKMGIVFTNKEKKLFL